VADSLAPDVVRPLLGGRFGHVYRHEQLCASTQRLLHAEDPEGAVAVALEMPPPFLLALAWRRGNGAPTLERFLDFLRAYRDEHAWAEDPAGVQGVS